MNCHWKKALEKIAKEKQRKAEHEAKLRSANVQDKIPAYIQRRRVISRVITSKETVLA